MDVPLRVIAGEVCACGYLSSAGLSKQWRGPVVVVAQIWQHEVALFSGILVVSN